MRCWGIQYISSINRSIVLNPEKENAPGDLQVGAPEVQAEERPRRGLEALHLLEALVPARGGRVWCASDGFIQNGPHMTTTTTPPATHPKTPITPIIRGQRLLHPHLRRLERRAQPVHARGLHLRVRPWGCRDEGEIEVGGVEVLLGEGELKPGPREEGEGLVVGAGPVVGQAAVLRLGCDGVELGEFVGTGEGWVI